jgi:hypothetical protein
MRHHPRSCAPVCWARSRDRGRSSPPETATSMGPDPVMENVAGLTLTPHQFTTAALLLQQQSRIAPLPQQPSGVEPGDAGSHHHTDPDDAGTVGEGAGLEPRLGGWLARSAHPRTSSGTADHTLSIGSGPGRPGCKRARGLAAAQAGDSAQAICNHRSEIRAAVLPAGVCTQHRQLTHSPACGLSDQRP